MQFTDEDTPDLTDFAVAGVLLLGTGLSYLLAVGIMQNTAYKSTVAVTENETGGANLAKLQPL